MSLSQGPDEFKFWQSKVLGLDGTEGKVAKEDVPTEVGGLFECDGLSAKSAADEELATVEMQNAAILDFADDQRSGIFQCGKFFWKSTRAGLIARSGHGHGERFVGPLEIVDRMAPAIERLLGL